MKLRENISFCPVFFFLILIISSKEHVATKTNKFIYDNLKAVNDEYN